MNVLTSRLNTIYAYSSRILLSGSALLAVFALLSCGGSQKMQPNPSESTTDTEGRFTLSVLNDSLYDSGDFSIDVSEEAYSVEVAVRGRNVEGLRGLYFELEFDPAELNPVRTESSPELAEIGTVLELGITDRPDVVTHGQVLANWDKHAGYSGSGVLATVKFAREPQQAGRPASAVPMSDEAKAPVVVFAGDTYGGESLTAAVFFTNPGDYDQNGEVGITDLTPLGLHFGETVDAGTGLGGGTASLLGYSVQTVIDGDGNGEINIGDITPIGLNFGNDILGGYNLYASADVADVPPSNDSPSTIAPTASTTGMTLFTLGNPAETRISFAYNQPTIPPSRVYFWARPVDSEGEEGTVSEVFELIEAPAPVLDLVAAPLSGNGTSDNPYEVEASTDHEVSLTHAVDGDVTTDPDALYYMYGLGDFLRRELDTEPRIITSLQKGASFTAEGLGELDESTGELDINDIFEGRFIIQALYGGRVSNVLNLLVPDPDNLPPTASISADAIGGVAPWTVNLSAEDSTDSDGEIATYEWDIGNDGTYDETGGTPDLTLDITEGGELEITLRVTDDDGATDTETAPLQTTGWQRSVLDEVSDTSPADPMVQRIDGNPAVAYRQFNTLKYIRAADSMGTSWNESVAVPLSVTAQHISLREVDGRPAMAYQRSLSNPGIYYVLGDSANATSFDQVQITSSNMDHSPTLNIIDGNPAIAYAWYTGDPDPYTLLYVRASDSLGNTGGSWDLITAGYVIDAETLLIDKQSLQITDSQLIGTDGRPCLMFIADNDEYGLDWTMYFTKAINASASNWSLPADIGNNGDDEIRYPAVTSIVNRPRIAFFIPGMESVTYNNAEELDGSPWGGAITLPLGPEPGRGYFPSLANVAGFPALAYYDAEDDVIRYSSTDDPEGDTGWEGNNFVGSPGEYDTSGFLNHYISLGAAVGQPVIVYHDVANAELVYSTFYEAP